MTTKLQIDGGKVVSGSNPLPVTLGSSLDYVDRSGTITLGGTSQQIAGALATRRYLLIQNHSDTAMWLDFGTAAVATQPSLYLAPGGVFEPLVAPAGTVNLLCATTGKAFTCKEG